jgi:hypothetical protein
MYYRTCSDDRKKSDIDEIIIVLIDRGSVPIYIYMVNNINNKWAIINWLNT